MLNFKTAMMLMVSRNPKPVFAIMFIVGICLVATGSGILTGTWINYAWLYNDYLPLIGLALVGLASVWIGVVLVFYASFYIGLMRFFK